MEGRCRDVISVAPQSLFGETEEKLSNTESRQTLTATRLELDTFIRSQGLWLGCQDNLTCPRTGLRTQAFS